MNIPVFPVALSLPGDAEWLATAPDGLAALATAAPARFSRSVAGLGAVGLIDLAERSAPADALTLYETWLAQNGALPDAFAIWFNFGVCLMRAGAAPRAVAAYQAALALKPDLAEATVNLGLALESLGRVDEALAAWRRALPPAESRRLLHVHLGRVLEDCGRLADAESELRAALLIEPDQPDVHQHLVHLRQRMCAWPVLDIAVPGITPDILGRNCGPLAALALHDDPAEVAAAAGDWIARKVPAAPQTLAPATGYAHARLRIGYLSSDFCRHAMSFLIAEVLERHDRDSFEIFGYCASPNDGSAERARVVAAFDHHVPIGAWDDQTAARRIRDDEIDILVDLNGLTKGARLGVLRWRPAPVQATYLGYIGPVPMPELDWMICDAVTVPPAQLAAYAPPPLILPGCYQANDSRVPDLPSVTRASEGLPDDAFVFCCFSHHYKITAEMFAAWLDILAATPGSVLWLVEDGPESRANLTRHWVGRGLEAERLIFAPRVDPARYRARMALGDLFLDTTPYNAGTIASDALRMGLPILTLAGRSFSARMAASLLTAIGLPDCIATDPADFVARAVALAREPQRLAVIRDHLAGDAWTRTLGDSAGFTRRLEDAYRGIARRPG